MRCLLQLTQSDRKQYGDFRLAELDAIAETLGPKHLLSYDASSISETCPFLMAEVPNDDYARAIGKRMVMLNAAYELLAVGSIEEVIATLKQMPMQYWEVHASEAKAWSLEIDGFNAKIKETEKKEMRAKFAFLPMKGPIRIKNPDTRLVLLAEYTAAPTSKFVRYLFGRHIADGNREVMDRYSLKTRRFIGPTSTAAELAFLMANMAKVQPGNVVYDPFVGTGSLLVAAAHFGAVTVGSDLDFRILHGIQRGNEEKYTLRDNFRQYSLPQPELVCSDQSRPPWRESVRFDSIICDPPYGVRAGARKIAGKDTSSAAASATGSGAGTVSMDTTSESEVASGSLSMPHVPQTTVYPVEDVMDDLLDTAAKYLVLGGRLVYLIPTTDEFTLEQLPKHPCLALSSCCEQVLRARFSRRLVTMVKTREFDPSLSTVRRDRSTVPEPSHAKVKEMVWNPSNVSEDTIQSLRAASLGLLHSGPLEAAQIAGRLALQVDFRPPPRSAVVAAAAASSDAQPPGPLVDEIKGDADRRAVFTAAKTAVSAAVAAADPSTLPKSKKKLKRFEVYVRRQIFRPERKAHIKAIRQERKAEKKAARLAAAAAGTIPIAAAGNLDSVNVSPASVTAATPAVTVSGVGSPNESTHTPSASSAAAVIAMDTTQS